MSLSIIQGSFLFYMAVVNDHFRQLKSLSDDGNISEEMARQFEFMRDEIKEIKAQQQNVSKVVQQLAEMLETKIVESITKVPDFDSPIPRKMPTVTPDTAK
jgi:hypothetical protein